MSPAQIPCLLSDCLEHWAQRATAPSVATVARGTKLAPSRCKPPSFSLPTNNSESLASWTVRDEGIPRINCLFLQHRARGPPSPPSFTHDESTCKNSKHESHTLFFPVYSHFQQNTAASFYLALLIPVDIFLLDTSGSFPPSPSPSGSLREVWAGWDVGEGMRYGIGPPGG